MADEQKQNDVVDLEEYAKAGSAPPRTHTYRIRVDKKKYDVHQSSMKGREILSLAGKDPARTRLDQKLRGGKTEKIGLDDVVDFTTPGIERFMTLPLDQTEGAVIEALRRDFRLGEEDEEYLDACGLAWEAIREEGAMWLLLHDFPVPNGYNVRNALLAIRIEAGYPTAPLDMCYFHPVLEIQSGGSLGQTQLRPTIDGKTFQRWSRHRTAANPWRPGVDSVATHVGLVEEWLAREVGNG